MRIRQLTALAFSVLLAGCAPAGSSAPSPTPQPTPTPSPSPTAAPIPTARATTAADDLFGDQPYSVVLPAGWRAYDLSDSTQQAAFEAVVQANPNLAGAMQMLRAIPGVRMAVNALLANVMIAITMPTNGIPIATIEQSFNAQFKAVPGVATVPTPTAIPLPGGTAVHWLITLKLDKPGGGAVTMEESIYLFANSTDAVILEFVTPGGGVIPDERAIASTFAFK